MSLKSRSKTKSSLSSHSPPHDDNPHSLAGVSTPGTIIATALTLILPVIMFSLLIRACTPGGIVY